MLIVSINLDKDLSMMQGIASSPSRAALYSPVASLMARQDWERLFADDIEAILELKRKHNAVILAHNYQTPEIFHCVSDIRGDNLALAREAQNLEQDVIIMAGVHFMAETVKLLNPTKTVLIPDALAGCSLAEGITAENVRTLRERHPGVPVVTYVNSSTAVKAETDVCCTSGNARRVVESLGVPEVIMIPDEFLARNIERETGIKCTHGQPAAKSMSVSRRRRSASTGACMARCTSLRIRNALPMSWQKPTMPGPQPA